MAKTFRLLGVAGWFFWTAATSTLLVMAQHQQQPSSMAPPSPPRLNGSHFKITLVEQSGFADFHDENGTVAGGYCIDIFATIAKHANFTYEFRSPSGLGSLCLHDEIDDDEDENNDTHSTRSPTIVPYAKTYQSQYFCGQSDVNDRPNNLTHSHNYSSSSNYHYDTPVLLPQEYATDMYLSLFYVTPARQLQNQFSISFHPPTTGAITFFGTAIQIKSVEDLTEQQQQGLQRPVCVLANTAMADYIYTSFPDLQTIPYHPETMGTIYESFASGACEIQINPNPVATRFILEQKRKNQCQAGSQGRPLGIVTDPLTFGFSQFAIGIRKDMDRDVVDTINYWMNYLMTCSPNDPECDSFSDFYPQAAGTGQECGYVAFPVPPSIQNNTRLLSKGAIAGVAIGSMGLIIGGLVISHWILLRRQRHRYKIRFVQQIARNISIGPSPRAIEADKLVEEIQHISSRKNGIIAKDDLWKWMFDIKLNFISDKDFEALWNALDVDGRGMIEPLEFFVFLSLCGPEFEQVSKEISNMPKIEKLKWASRRLTNYKLQGERGVRKMEHDLERRTRQNVAPITARLSPNNNNNNNNKKKTRRATLLPSIVATTTLTTTTSTTPDDRVVGVTDAKDQTPTEFFTTYPTYNSSSGPGSSTSSTANTHRGDATVKSADTILQTTLSENEQPALAIIPSDDVPDHDDHIDPDDTDAGAGAVGRTSVMSTLSEMTYSA